MGAAKVRSTTSRPRSLTISCSRVQTRLQLAVRVCVTFKIMLAFLRFGRWRHTNTLGLTIPIEIGNSMKWIHAYACAMSTNSGAYLITSNIGGETCEPYQTFSPYHRVIRIRGATETSGAVSLGYLTRERCASRSNPSLTSTQTVIRIINQSQFWCTQWGKQVLILISLYWHLSRS